MVNNINFYHTTKMGDELTMYILVNRDLNMSPGKVAAQVGHVVEKLTNRILGSLYEDDGPISQLNIDYQKYRENGHRKITLGLHEKDMRKFLDDPDSEHIIDEGRTEIPPNSLTVIGFIPSKENKKKFEGYRTY